MVDGANVDGKDLSSVVDDCSGATPWDERAIKRMTQRSTSFEEAAVQLQTKRERKFGEGESISRPSKVCFLTDRQAQWKSDVNGRNGTIH